MRKIIIIIIIMLMLIIPATFAEDSKIVVDEHVQDGEISTRAMQPCPITGYHHMQSKGTGTVFSSVGTPTDPETPNWQFSGKLFVCSSCNYTIICQNNPLFSETIRLGHYAESSPKEAVYSGYEMYLCDYHPDPDVPLAFRGYNNAIAGTFDYSAGYYWYWPY